MDVLALQGAPRMSMRLGFRDGEVWRSCIPKEGVMPFSPQAKPRSCWSCAVRIVKETGDAERGPRLEMGG